MSGKPKLGSGQLGQNAIRLLKNARYTELKQSPVNHVADLNESAKDTNRTLQEKWSDHRIFITPMKWKWRECIFFLKIANVTSVSGTKVIKFSTSSWLEEENREAQVAFWLLKSEIQTKPDKGWWRELLFPPFLRKTLHLSAVRDFLLRAITGWLTTITVCVSGKGKKKKEKRTPPGKEPRSYHTLVIFVT